MELKDIKHAILHKQRIRCGDLTGTPFGCIMRLAHNDNIVCDLDRIKLSPESRLGWQYLVEFLDKNNNTVYTGKLEECEIIFEQCSLEQEVS